MAVTVFKVALGGILLISDFSKLIGGSPKSPKL